MLVAARRWLEPGFCRDKVFLSPEDIVVDDTIFWGSIREVVEGKTSFTATCQGGAILIYSTLMFTCEIAKPSGDVRARKHFLFQPVLHTINH